MNIHSLSLLCIIVLGLCFQSLAQTDSLKVEKQKKPLQLKGYVAGLYERAPVSYGDANSLGLQGAVILKNHLQVGFYGVKYTNSNFKQRLIFPNYFQMNYQHGGFLLGYRTHLEKNYEFNLESKLGFGEVKWEQIETRTPFLADKFMMMHMQASIDYVLVKFLAFNAYVGYRWMDGLDITGLVDEDFKGVYFGLALKVGGFK